MQIDRFEYENLAFDWKIKAKKSGHKTLRYKVRAKPTMNRLYDNKSIINPHVLYALHKTCTWRFFILLQVQIELSAVLSKLFSDTKCLTNKRYTTFNAAVLKITAMFLYTRISFFNQDKSCRRIKIKRNKSKKYSIPFSLTPVDWRSDFSSPFEYVNDKFQIQLYAFYYFIISINFSEYIPHTHTDIIFLLRKYHFETLQKIFFSGLKFYIIICHIYSFREYRLQLSRNVWIFYHILAHLGVFKTECIIRTAVKLKIHNLGCMRIHTLEMLIKFRREAIRSIFYDEGNRCGWKTTRVNHVNAFYRS